MQTGICTPRCQSERLLPRCWSRSGKPAETGGGLIQMFWTQNRPTTNELLIQHCSPIKAGQGFFQFHTSSLSAADLQWPLTRMNENLNRLRSSVFVCNLNIVLFKMSSSGGNKFNIFFLNFVLLCSWNVKGQIGPTAPSTLYILCWI